MTNGDRQETHNSERVFRNPQLKVYKSIAPVQHCMADLSERTLPASRNVPIIPLPFLAHLSRYLLLHTITTKHLTRPELVAIGFTQSIMKPQSLTWGWSDEEWVAGYELRGAGCLALFLNSDF